ncbi:MAG: OmpH family outer membrane protein [Rhodospirillales bacterium]
MGRRPGLRGMARGVVALAVLVLAGEAVVPAKAADAAEMRIAVLDVERVRRSAQAVKTIHAQLGTFVDAYRNETQKEEQEIRTAQEELARKRLIVTPEAYADERRKLEEQLIQAQTRVQERRQSLERVNAEAMQQVQDVLSRIVGDVANEQQLTLILRKDQVVFLKPDLEITDQVLQRLDRQLPSVSISNPGR